MSTAIAAPEAILPGSDGRIHRFTAAGQPRCGLSVSPRPEEPHSIGIADIEPCPQCVPPDEAEARRLKREHDGKRVVVLLKVIEDAADELIRIEFEDKTLGVERFKRMQMIADDAMAIHKACARRVADFAKTDYALRACTVDDIENPRAHGLPALARGFGVAQEPNDMVSLLRDASMTNQRRADQDAQQGRFDAVRSLAEALAALPEGPARERVQQQLDRALDALEGGT